MTGLAQRASDAYSSDDTAGGNEHMAQAQAHILSVDNAIQQIVERLEQQALMRRDTSMHAARHAANLAITGGAIGLALALILTATILRSITGPLRRLEASMTAITHGRLDVPVPPAGRDEIGAMTNALTMLRESLPSANGSKPSASAPRLRRSAPRPAARGDRRHLRRLRALRRRDRLVICNGRYREIFGLFGLEAAPGVTFEALVRGVAGACPGPQPEGVARRTARTPPPSVGRLREPRRGRRLGQHQRAADREGGVVGV